jgi:hypothetical protein
MPVKTNCNDMTSYVTFVLASDKRVKHTLFDSLHIVSLTYKINHVETGFLVASTEKARSCRVRSKVFR